MWRRWIETIIKPRRAAGAQLTLLPDKAIQIRFALCSLEKGKFRAESAHSNIQSIEGLKQYIAPEIPIGLSITGKGVLQKKVTNPEADETSILNEILPGASPEDFYIHKGKGMISVIRREQAEEIIGEFKAHGLPLVWMEPGGEGPEAAAQSILEGGIYTDIPSVAQIGEEWRQKRIFKPAGWAALVFFLTALLVNFIAFDALNRKTQELTEQLSQHKDRIAHLEKLRKQVKEREEFLSRTGWMQGSRASWYADRIGQSLPAGVQLSRMTVFPPEKELGSGAKTISFSNKEISIEGQCSNSTQLSEWIRKLKSFAWIKSVQVENYREENAKGIGNFNISVMTK